MPPPIPFELGGRRHLLQVASNPCLPQPPAPPSVSRPISSGGDLVSGNRRRLLEATAVEEDEEQQQQPSFPSLPVIVLPETSPGAPGRALLSEGAPMQATLIVRDLELDKRGRQPTVTTFAALFDFGPLEGSELMVGNAAAGGSPLEGKLQELRVFGGPRTEEALAGDSRRQVGCLGSPVAIWHMSERGGRVAADACGAAEAFTWYFDREAPAGPYSPVPEWTEEVARLCPANCEDCSCEKGQACSCTSCLPSHPFLWAGPANSSEAGEQQPLLLCHDSCPDGMEPSGEDECVTIKSPETPAATQPPCDGDDCTSPAGEDDDAEDDDVSGPSDPDKSWDVVFSIGLSGFKSIMDFTPEVSSKLITVIENIAQVDEGDVEVQELMMRESVSSRRLLQNSGDLADVMDVTLVIAAETEEEAEAIRARLRAAIVNGQLEKDLAANGYEFVDAVETEPLPPSPDAPDSPRLSAPAPQIGIAAGIAGIVMLVAVVAILYVNRRRSALSTSVKALPGPKALALVPQNANADGDGGGDDDIESSGGSEDALLLGGGGAPSPSSAPHQPGRIPSPTAPRTVLIGRQADQAGGGGSASAAALVTVNSSGGGRAQRPLSAKPRTSNVQEEDVLLLDTNKTILPSLADGAKVTPIKQSASLQDHSDSFDGDVLTLESPTKGPSQASVGRYSKKPLELVLDSSAAEADQQQQQDVLLLDSPNRSLPTQPIAANASGNSPQPEVLSIDSPTSKPSEEQAPAATSTSEAAPSVLILDSDREQISPSQPVLLLEEAPRHSVLTVVAEDELDSPGSAVGVGNGGTEGPSFVKKNAPQHGVVSFVAEEEVLELGGGGSDVLTLSGDHGDAKAAAAASGPEAEVRPPVQGRPDQAKPFTGDMLQFSEEDWDADPAKKVSQKLAENDDDDTRFLKRELSKTREN